MLAAAVAEAEFELGDGGRVLLRPSGTEPLVRVMVEAAHRRAGAARSPTGSPGVVRRQLWPDADEPARYRLRQRDRASLGWYVVDIREIDPRRRGARCAGTGRSGGPPRRLPSLRLLPAVGGGLGDRTPTGARTSTSVLLGAFDGDTMWGAARVDHEPATTTCTSAIVDLLRRTPPGSGAGIGRALAEASYDVARPTGPPADDDRGLRAGRRRRPPGLLFAGRWGSPTALVDGMKVVDLHETEPTWDALEARAAPRHADYRIVTWRDRGARRARRRLLPAQRDVLRRGADGRAGDRAREVGRGPGPRARASATPRPAARGRRRGRRRRTARLVALTEAVVNERRTPARLPERHAWSTRRTAVTGSAWRSSSPTTASCARQFPECRVLLTGNADVNAPMNARQRRAGLPRGGALRGDAAGDLRVWSLRAARRAGSAGSGPPDAPGRSELAQPDEPHRVVAVLAQHQRGAAAGGLDVLLQVGAVDRVPDAVAPRRPPRPR